jgi:serine/threonine-protein kinase
MSRPDVGRRSSDAYGTGAVRDRPARDSSASFFADLTATAHHNPEGERSALTRRHHAKYPAGDVPAAPPAPSAPINEDWDSLDLPARYQLISLLGKGGQGAVYLCNDQTLGRHVAVKRCHARGDQDVRRFTAEALTTASLEHPGICPVHDAGERFLVMKCLGGSSLLALFERSPWQSDLAKRAEILIQVCHVVEYAHSRGIIHRDLKAENVLLGRHGEVVVIDWGLAVGLEDGRLPRSWQQVSVSPNAGTPACMAPEVARGARDDIGTATDAWAMGAMLYHALAGQMPYEHSSHMDDLLLDAAENRWPALENLPDPPPLRLIQLQRQAMALQPSERPTLAAIRESLRQWLLQSGNLAAAGHALELARLLERRADLCGPQERENRIDCYAQALNQYDRALALAPDNRTASEERRLLLQRYIAWLMHIGEYMLARFLLRNRREAPPRTADLPHP